MTTDLWCLVVNALWGMALTMIESTSKTRIAGVAWNLGNRETEPEFPPWIKRVGRTLANHKENFPVFLTAVVVVHLAGKNDHASAYAAVGYVIARFLHAGLYIAGITRVRSLVFTVGTVCTLVIVSRLVL